MVTATAARGEIWWAKVMDTRRPVLVVTRSFDDLQPIRRSFLTSRVEICDALAAMADS